MATRSKTTRRVFLAGLLATAAMAGIGFRALRKGIRAGAHAEDSSGADAIAPATESMRGDASAGDLPTRPLGATGRSMTILGLGGQSALQSGPRDLAVAIIHAALDEGVNYFDTSPKYGESESILGEALTSERARVFLASKTHDRTAQGSRKLLERSLSRLRTDYLDLWQIHSVQNDDDVRSIFAPDGVYEALVRARDEGLVRHIGVTGHYDPTALLNAIRTERFDSILMAINAADVHHRPFTTDLLAEAVQQRMAIVGMKVPSRGTIFRQGGLLHPAGITDVRDAFGYAWSLPVSGIIVGCESVERVRQNAALARAFAPLSAERVRELERKTRAYARDASWFKNWNGVPWKRLMRSSWT